MRYLFVLFILIFSKSVFAFPAVYETRYSPSPGEGWYGRGDEAFCAAAFAAYEPPAGYVKTHYSFEGSVFNCFLNYRGTGRNDWMTGGSRAGVTEKTDYFCPANSSLSGSECICDAGFSEKSNSCVANVCEAGQSSSALVPVAWARYYTGGTGSIPIEGGGTAEIVGEAQIPDSVCMGGCEYWNVGSVRSYISFDRPSGTGSYQVLNELNLETSGSECSEETNLSEPVEPAPVCNGVVGEVNGKKYCAPSDSGGGSGGEGGGTDPGEGGGTDPGEGGSTDPGEGGGNPPGGGSGGGTNPGGGSGGGDGDGEDGEGPGGGGGPGSGSEWSVPTFYESKYPDGMSGVWQSSGLAAAAGVFDGLAGAFVPPWSDTNGACQSFYLNLDIGIFNFGRFDISPPCFVWSFLWLCMQIGAIFLFRALVFGG